MSNDNDEPRFTIDVNGTRYALNEEFMSAIERRAERAFAENHYLEMWWKTTDGEPTLVIETEGKMMPKDRIENLKLEMLEPDDSEGDQNPYKEGDHDAGDGKLRSVDTDNVDSDKTSEPSSDDDDRIENPKAFIKDPNRVWLPDPEDEDNERVPAAPEEFPDEEDGVLMYFVPEDPELEEVWETGKAAVSGHSWVEWNLQQRANEAPEAARKEIMRDGEWVEVNMTDRHDQWEGMLKMYDCEKIKELGVDKNVDSSEADRKPWDYESKGEGESVAKGGVGNRFNL